MISAYFTQFRLAITLIFFCASLGGASYATVKLRDNHWKPIFAQLKRDAAEERLAVQEVTIAITQQQLAANAADTEQRRIANEKHNKAVLAGDDLFRVLRGLPVPTNCSVGATPAESAASAVGDNVGGVADDRSDYDLEGRKQALDEIILRCARLNDDARAHNLANGLPE